MPDTTVQFPAPVPPPEAFAKDQPIGAPVTLNTSEVSPDQTIYAQTKDGFASLPASSFDSLMQYDPSAKIVPPPSQGQVLVKLSSGHGATLPVASLEELRKQDPDVKVIATGGATANMQESPLSGVEKAALASSNAASAVGTFAGDVASGVAKGSAESLSHIGPMVPSLAPHGFAARPAVDLTNQDFHDANTGESLGKGVEGLAEWMTAIETGGAIGSDVVKALSASERLGMVAKAAKFLDNNPRIASVIGNAALSAGSTAIHGGTAKDAVTSGIAGGATSGVLEGIGALSNKLGATGETKQMAKILVGYFNDNDISATFKDVLDKAESEAEANHIAFGNDLLSKLPEGTPVPEGDTLEKVYAQAHDIVQPLNPQAASDYANALKIRNDQLQAFKNPLVRKLQAGTLDDATKEILSGKTVKANIDDLYTALGPQNQSMVGEAVFQSLFKDAADAKGNVQVKPLLEKWNKVPSDVRDKLFSGMPSDTVKDFETSLQGVRSVKNMQTLVRVGLIGAGVGFGLQGARQVVSGKGSLAGITLDELIASALVGSGSGLKGFQRASSIIDQVAENPSLWNSFTKVNNAANAVAPLGKPAAVYGVSHFVYDPAKGLTPAEQPEQPAQK